MWLKHYNSLKVSYCFKIPQYLFAEENKAILTSSPCQPTRVTLESRKKAQLYRQKQPKNTPFNAGLSSFAKPCAAFTLSLSYQINTCRLELLKGQRGCAATSSQGLLHFSKWRRESRESRRRRSWERGCVRAQQDRTPLRTCHLL